MKNKAFGWVLLTAVMFSGCCQETTNPRKEQLLRHWQFQKEISMNEASGEGWQDVTIPHDWAISGEFDRNNDLQEVVIVQNGETTPTWKTGRSGGLPWMGRGHYHTRIAVDTTRFHTLVFDGAMSHADVYINGEEVCYWPYGYNTFDCYLLPSLLTSDSVDIDVFLENKPQQSRWYPGAGLYRNVRLISTDKVHIPTFGVLVLTPQVSEQEATVEMRIDLQNGVDETTAEAEGVTLQTDIIYQNKVVAVIHGEQGSTNVPKPHLWSPETPHLYYARTRVLRGEEVIDEVSTRFGIRSISYTPEYGFQLNGKTRKFKGVCNHHDLGPLGAAVHKDALRHQIRLLQDMGCDAIRTSHNMPAPELVELCDEMGMMMMIEPFDIWNHGKTDNDYHVEFADWWQKDITNMVRHYRNNACVMLWSSGNEVWNQVLPDGIQLVSDLQALFHELDPTRPVTNGMDQAKQVIHNGFGAAVELPGFNYRTSRYEEAYEHLPQKMILGSETASTVSSRGVYKIPAVIKDFANYADNQSSGYDVEYCPWSGLPEQDFQLQDDYNWTLGQFVWTGFDYLGEPSPYDTDAWPSHSSYFGIIDLASLPKDRYYLYRSQWNTQEPTLHLLPHWNWQEGDLVPVFCYTSYPEAELFVNGKSQGRLRHATAEEANRMRKGEVIEGVSRMPQVGDFIPPEWGSAPKPELLPRYRLMWYDIPFEAGEIEVVAYDEQGRKAASEKIRTAAEPTKITAVWANQEEDPEELCYVTIRIEDNNGNLCPFADSLIRCESDGFVATANGDATCLDSFVKPQMHAFAGQCTFIIRKGCTATFSADRLQSASIKL